MQLLEKIHVDKIYGNRIKFNLIYELFEALDWFKLS